MNPSFAIWITGLPSAGKSTITRALVAELTRRGIEPAVLESDAVRRVLTPRPTYSDEERQTFYDALAYIGALLTQHGVPVIFDATANRRSYRAAARARIPRLIEVYVECPVDICVKRDVKGIYGRAADGTAAYVPGVQVPYEVPEHPDATVSGAVDSPEAAALQIVAVLEQGGVLTPKAAAVAGELL